MPGLPSSWLLIIRETNNVAREAFRRSRGTENAPMIVLVHFTYKPISSVRFTFGKFWVVSYLLLTSSQTRILLHVLKLSCVTSMTLENARAQLKKSLLEAVDHMAGKAKEHLVKPHFPVQEFSRPRPEGDHTEDSHCYRSLRQPTTSSPV
jgi:hypothetical protein